MQSIIKIFLVLALIAILVAIAANLKLLDRPYRQDEKTLNAYYHFAQHLFILSGVLLICATALLYKYGWGKQDARK